MTPMIGPLYVTVPMAPGIPEKSWKWMKWESNRPEITPGTGEPLLPGLLVMSQEMPLRKMPCCSSHAKALTPTSAPGLHETGGAPSHVVIPVTPVMAAVAIGAARATAARPRVRWQVFIVELR